MPFFFGLCVLGTQSVVSLLVVQVALSLVGPHLSPTLSLHPVHRQPPPVFVHELQHPAHGTGDLPLPLSFCASAVDDIDAPASPTARAVAMPNRKLRVMVLPPQLLVFGNPSARALEKKLAAARTGCLGRGRQTLS
jgi:hypothetical protein